MQKTAKIKKKKLTKNYKFDKKKTTTTTKNEKHTIVSTKTRATL